MTATLRLHVDEPGPTPMAHGAVITVRQVADSEGAYPQVPFETAVVADSNGAHLNVPSGHYRLEARLANGEVLRESRTLRERDDEEVRFDAHGSPHEWLSWQSVSGNVPRKPGYDEQLKQFAKRRQGPISQATFGIPVDMYSEFGGPELSIDPDFFPDLSEYSYLGRTGVELFGRGRSIVRIPAPISPGSFTAGEMSPVLLLVEAHMSHLRSISPIAAQMTAQSDAMMSVWTPQLVSPIRDIGRSFRRRFNRRKTQRFVALMVTPNEQLLAFLPFPWSTRDGGQAQIELLRDRSATNGRGFKVSVIDGDRAALLSYLGTSRMSEALAAFDTDSMGHLILQDMQAKRNNPLAAAAAAYVGLAYPVGDPRRESWSPWLRNLMNWFPAIPDGAILRGRDLLERAETDADLEQALGAFKTAYRRGPPFLSVGVRHLLDGLALFAQDRDGKPADATVRRMHAEVADLALLTDPDQAFTVLKLPKSSIPFSRSRFS